MGRVNRTRLRWRGVATLAVACLTAFAAATTASAAVTIGQLPMSAPSAMCPATGAGHDYLQPSVTGGNLYSARQAGTITSWSTLSSSRGATFTFKAFRRTSDPDVFQVVGRDTGNTLSAGLNTFPANIGVRSGDLIGVHERGGGANSSCTFFMPGDGALRRPGDLGSDQSAPFSPVANVRLNLSAVLVPSNAFTITAISRNRRNGTARITTDLSNPGFATIGGKGLKKSRATTAVARRVSLKVATTGKSKRKLARTGSLKVAVTVTFNPTGGDPSSQIVRLQLSKRR
jgi:hypothetical protein